MGRSRKYFLIGRIYPNEFTLFPITFQVFFSPAQHSSLWNLAHLPRLRICIEASKSAKVQTAFEPLFPITTIEEGFQYFPNHLASPSYRRKPPFTAMNRQIVKIAILGVRAQGP
jgi:hypothetical protein